MSNINLNRMTNLELLYSIKYYINELFNNIKTKYGIIYKIYMPH